VNEKLMPGRFERREAPDAHDVRGEEPFRARQPDHGVDQIPSKRRDDFSTPFFKS
jgi:hypothetical protein